MSRCPLKSSMVGVASLFVLLVYLFPLPVDASTSLEVLLSKKGRWDSQCQGKKTKVGVLVYSLNSSRKLFGQNENHLFIPASNLKLVTTAAALQKLSPNYRFKTKLYYDGVIEKGVLKGDLYIKGFGDPKLVSEELWLIVREIMLRGITRIEGDIVADDSYFDNERYPAGWKGSLNSRAYSAQIGALSLNFNTIKVYVDPEGRKSGQPWVILDPPTKFVTLENKAVIVGEKGRSHITIERTTRSGNNTIVVGGTLRSGKKRKGYYRNVFNPPLFLATVFKEFLEQEGIAVTGSPSSGIAGDNFVELYEHESAPLSLIVRGLNKFSNNFMAEQILKTMAAEIQGVPGTIEKGLDVVQGFLEEVGIKRGSYVLSDGSGFSRSNRLSPAQLVKILSYMYRDFSVRPEFISSLSVMGVDGSLKDRGHEKSINRYTKAKTGTLNGVSALSGYVSSESGSVYAFSILMNRFRCSVDRVWKFQDDLVRAIRRLPDESSSTISPPQKTISH